MFYNTMVSSSISNVKRYYEPTILPFICYITEYKLIADNKQEMSFYQLNTRSLRGVVKCCEKVEIQETYKFLQTQNQWEGIQEKRNSQWQTKHCEYRCDISREVNNLQNYLSWDNKINNNVRTKSKEHRKTIEREDKTNQDRIFTRNVRQLYKG
jgi:hypothetical protein